MKKPRFLDLTVPLTKNSIYKDSSQGKAWGSDLSLEESFSVCLLSSKFWRTFSWKQKGELIQI